MSQFQCVNPHCPTFLRRGQKFTHDEQIDCPMCKKPLSGVIITPDDVTEIRGVRADIIIDDDMEETENEEHK